MDGVAWKYYGDEMSKILCPVIFNLFRTSSLAFHFLLMSFHKSWQPCSNSMLHLYGSVNTIINEPTIEELWSLLIVSHIWLDADWLRYTGFYLAKSYIMTCAKYMYRKHETSCDSSPCSCNYTDPGGNIFLELIYCGGIQLIFEKQAFLTHIYFILWLVFFDALKNISIVRRQSENLWNEGEYSVRRNPRPQADCRNTFQPTVEEKH